MSETQVSHPPASIRVRLDIPEDLRRKAMFVFRELALRWGARLQFAEPGQGADFFYSIEAPSPATMVPGPWLQCDPAAYRPQAQFEERRQGGFRLWARVGCQAPLPDVVAGAFRLLTFQDEAGVADHRRDRWGSFMTTDLPAGRRASLAWPLVEEHAGFLLGEISSYFPGVAGHLDPIWPEGKPWALVLTHDVDTLHVGAPPEILKNLARFVLQRDPSRLRLAALGMVSRRQKGNLFDAFRRWESLEEGWGLRSAFYLAVVPEGIARDRRDCNSRADNTELDWDHLRSLVDRGWEVGLHAPIKARVTPGAFRLCRVWLEDRLKRPITGLRHHYFALDWRDPAKTLRQHAMAGFTYDTSIAWRDEPGLRAGTCLPFFPFDVEKGENVGLVELPTLMMDNHVADLANQSRGGPSAGAQGIAKVLAGVRHAGGMAVLDWHQENFNDLPRSRRMMDALTGIVKIAAQERAWVCTPFQAAQHWEQRALRLLGDCPREGWGWAPSAPRSSGDARRGGLSNVERVGER